MSDRIVILDRDGVINEDSDNYIKSVDEWHPLPGSIDAMVRLYHAGYRIAIATNQSGLARGLFTPADLDAIHQMLRTLLAAQGARIEMIAYCPHGPDAHCRCRKPQPGLLESIGQRLGIDLDGVPFIGDSLSDILAARAAGASPWLVRSGKGTRTLTEIASHPERALLERTPTYSDLSAAVDALLDS